MRIADALQPELTELNRLTSRPPLRPFDSADDARSDDPPPWRRSLDGSWRFHLASRPDDAPSGWAEAAFDDSRWRTIEVPGCWTRQQTGDLPHYTNVQMPWPDLEPPETPDANPTGLYRTTFHVPRRWAKRDVVVHFGGVESVVVVWCNGRFVGLGKDSRLPSEYFKDNIYTTFQDDWVAFKMVNEIVVGFVQ